jgi:hypothetical protein
MALYSSLSRYRNDTSGQTATRLPVAKRGYITYVVREGDTIENIATRYMGNPSRYWEVADMNPQVKFPLDLTTGMLLRLPA